MNVASKIIDFEAGDLSPQETVELFSELVKSGIAWQLQGMYGRYATSLIEDGYLDEEGNVLGHFHPAEDEEL